MKPVARFVTRLQGEGDGLFVGSVTNDHPFKPNTVYEIVDVLGELVIREVGMAAGSGPDNCAGENFRENGTMFSWGSEIGYIMSCYGNRVLLSLEEYDSIRPKCED